MHLIRQVPVLFIGTGTCSVHEYCTTSCELVRGPYPGAKQASIDFRPPTNSWAIGFRVASDLAD
jgi:hypothetical protein